MEGKYQQPAYPLAPATMVPRSDEETAGFRSEAELKKKKRMKCFMYIAAFAVFQTIIIVVFALTVARIRTPKVRLGDITVTNNGNGNLRLTARVLVKNTNFGHYKFDSSVATIKSGDNSVGEFVIPEARARARSTKKIYIIVDINSPGTNSGVLALTAEARLKGKIKLMKVLKKKKSADMSCRMSVNLTTNSIQDLTCK